MSTIQDFPKGNDSYHITYCALPYYTLSSAVSTRIYCNALPGRCFGRWIWSSSICQKESSCACMTMVTDELDIFGAFLTPLLLKEDGSIVKIKLYLQGLSEIFGYTRERYSRYLLFSGIDVAWEAIKNYLTKEPKDHSVLETIYEMMKETGVYDIWHDYGRTTTSTQAHCKREKEEKERMNQESSPGILMIIEAEDLTIVLLSSRLFKNILVEAYLTVISALMSRPDDITTRLILAHPANSDDCVW